jgi:alpha-tubulin suppressor-like RCC1 family protein
MYFVENNIGYYFETFTQIPTLQNVKKLYVHDAPIEIITLFYALTEENVLQGIGDKYFGDGLFGPNDVGKESIGAVTITSNVTELFSFIDYLCFKQNDKYYYIDTNTGEFLPIESWGYFNKKPIDNIKQILTPCTSGFIYLDNNDDMYYGINDFYNDAIGSSYTCYNKYYRTGLKRIPISNIKDIVFSENGLTTLYVLTEDGKVYGKGQNDRGQLGLGDNINRDEYTLLPIDNVKKIDAGNDHTIVLKNDGTVWVTGVNAWGNLGLGNTTDQNTFKQVTTPNVKFKDIGAYNIYSVLIDEDGNLYGAGSGARNGSGKDGNTITFTKNTILPSPVKELIGSAMGFVTVVLLEDKTVWICGDDHNEIFGATNSLNFVKLHDFNNIEKIVINSDIAAMLLINSNKELFMLGDNFIKLNNFDPEFILTPLKIADNVKDVYIERKNIFYIKEDNTLWSCGINFGQMSKDITPFWTYIDHVKVAENIKECFPRETAEQNTSDFIFIKDLNGHIYTTGNNVYGQLGFHELDENHIAEEVFKLTKLKNPSEFKNGNSTVIIDGKFVNVKSFASSKNHSYIITDNGDIYIKGSNEHGQLDVESSYIENYQYYCTNTSIKEIECGNDFTLFLIEGGYVAVYGKDTKDQLIPFEQQGQGILANINHIRVIDDITVVENMDNEIYFAYKGSGFVKKDK